MYPVSRSWPCKNAKCDEVDCYSDFAHLDPPYLADFNCGYQPPDNSVFSAARTGLGQRRDTFQAMLASASSCEDKTLRLERVHSQDDDGRCMAARARKLNIQHMREFIDYFPAAAGETTV
jgi:hypothetical protein